MCGLRFCIYTVHILFWFVEDTVLCHAEQENYKFLVCHVENYKFLGISRTAHITLQGAGRENSSIQAG